MPGFVINAGNTLAASGPEAAWGSPRPGNGWNACRPRKSSGLASLRPNPPVELVESLAATVMYFVVFLTIFEYFICNGVAEIGDYIFRGSLPSIDISIAWMPLALVWPALF